MRLSQDKKDFIKQNLLAISPQSLVYLFGSRVDESQKGGDIDILWLTNSKNIDYRALTKFRISFFKEFGIQKLDIVNYTLDEENSFKSIALENAIEL